MKKEKIVVGLNEFIEEEEPIETLRIGPEVEKRQIKGSKRDKKKEK